MTPTPSRTTDRRRGPGGRVGRAAGRATALLALVVATSAPLLAGTSAPAGAQVPPVTGASCAPGQGVTVVVDFNGLPGGIRVGCAVGAQANGLQALAAAGFSAATGDAPGVVCTIDGVPTEGYPFCWLTGGYWSYWRAPRGGSWAFSPVGAGGGPLPVDSVEGWSWAPGFASQPPRASEASVPPATPPTSSTSTSTSTTTSTTRPATTTTRPPTSSSTTAPAGSSTTAPGPTSVPATTPPKPPSTSTPAAGAVAGSGATAGALPRTGSDTRTAVAAALGLLAVGAALVAGARRRASPSR